MRDIKLVGYGSVDDVDEANIRTALEESGVSKITFYSVEPANETIRAQSREISDLKAELEELKKDG